MPRGDNQNRPEHYDTAMQAPIEPPVWDIVDDAGRVVVNLWTESAVIAEAFAEGMMGSPVGAGLGVLTARKVGQC